MIRRATNADIEPVTALIYSILREYGLNPDPEGTDSDLKNIEKNFEDNGGCFDVLLNSTNNLVGTVALFKLAEDVCELRKMYLHPLERGKGKGKFLLEHALKRAKELGFRKVTLETATVLQEAITMYKKYGFREFEGENASSRCDQTYFLNICAEQSAGDKGPR